MSAELQEPEAGMVVRFNYQWADARQPHKDRPACVVFVKLRPDPRPQPRSNQDGPVFVKEVIYVPISTKPPSKDQVSLKIPDQVCRHIGLQEESWVIVSECNVQYWPNDLSRVPGADGEWLYGFVPPRFFRKIRDEMVRELKEQRLKMQNVLYLPPRNA